MSWDYQGIESIPVGPNVRNEDVDMFVMPYLKNISAKLLSNIWLKIAYMLLSMP